MSEPNRIEVSGDPARANVLRVLEDRYEAFAEAEQRARLTDVELAEDYHRLGVMVLTARMNEEDDPVPPEPVADCLTCAVSMRRGK